MGSLQERNEKRWVGVFSQDYESSLKECKQSAEKICSDQIRKVCHTFLSGEQNACITRRRYVFACDDSAQNQQAVFCPNLSCPEAKETHEECMALEQNQKYTALKCGGMFSDEDDEVQSCMAGKGFHLEDVTSYQCSGMRFF
jgi:hypothetical protein